MARWPHAQHGALAREEGEGEQGLTVRYQALGGVSRNGEARAEIGEGGIEKMAHELRKNGWSRARGSNGDGGAMRARSGGERARERARRRAWSGGGSGECAGAVHGRRG